jgi:flavodoxin
MKSIIIYYSYSGNTREVAGALSRYLGSKGETEVVELKALDESDKFLAQAGRALRHKRAEIEPINFDLGKYDLICFGTPVWAFGPAPAMNTCLDKCSGLAGKEIVLFSTYGSGTGNQRCLKFMQAILSKKGAGQFSSFSIPQFKVKDKGFILSQIKEKTRL